MKRLIITIATDFEDSGGIDGLNTTMHDPEMRKLFINSILDTITAKTASGNAAVMWELKELKT